jgi:hypothetical protein
MSNKPVKPLMPAIIEQILSSIVIFIVISAICSPFLHGWVFFVSTPAAYGFYRFLKKIWHRIPFDQDIEINDRSIFDVSTMSMSHTMFDFYNPNSSASSRYHYWEH